MDKAQLRDLLLEEAIILFDGCTSEENPEYLRGMSELIAGVTGEDGVTTEQTAGEVSYLING